jgi:hypothetical protein
MAKLGLGGVVKVVGGVGAVSLVVACGSGGDGAQSSGGAGGNAANTGGSGGMAASGAAQGGSAAGTSSSPDGCRPKLVKPEENPKAVKLVTQEVAAGAGATRITSVAVHGDSLIYTTSSGMYRIPKAGGAPETMTSQGVINHLFVVGDVAYYMGGKTLFSVPTSATGVMPTKVIETTLEIGSDYLFAIDATSAYAWVRPTDSIQALALADGTATTLLTGQDSENWLLNGDSIYYAGANNAIMKLPKTGGTPQLVYQTGHSLWAPGIDGTQLYGGSMLLQKVDPPNEKTLMTAGVGFIEQIVPQGDLLLWAGWEGSVGYLAKDGSRCGTVVDQVHGFADWAHDDANFYIALENAIYRIPF